MKHQFRALLALPSAPAGTQSLQHGASNWTGLLLFGFAGYTAATSDVLVTLPPSTTSIDTD